MNHNKFAAHRAFLKDTLRLQIDFRQTDQNQGITPPAIQKPSLEGQKLILLPDPQAFKAFAGTDLIDAIGRRRSHRHYQPLPFRWPNSLFCFGLLRASEKSLPTAVPCETCLRLVAGMLLKATLW